MDKTDWQKDLDEAARLVQSALGSLNKTPVITGKVVNKMEDKNERDV